MPIVEAEWRLHWGEEEGERDLHTSNSGEIVYVFVGIREGNKMKDRPSTGSTKCGCPDGARTTDVIRIIGTCLYSYKTDI